MRWWWPAKTGEHGVGKGVAFLHPATCTPPKSRSPAFCSVAARGGRFRRHRQPAGALFFLLLLHNDKQHLFSLSYLSRFMLNDSNVERLRKAATGEEVVEILTTHVWENTGTKKKATK
jgi:mannitol/fructose-specific phosphotransferase system IIA component (Ntr-type)